MKKRVIQCGKCKCASSNQNQVKIYFINEGQVSRGRFLCTPCFLEVDKRMRELHLGQEIELE